jgi:hypothetical protein
MVRNGRCKVPYVVGWSVILSSKRKGRLALHSGGNAVTCIQYGLAAREQKSELQ